MQPSPLGSRRASVERLKRAAVLTERSDRRTVHLRLDHLPQARGAHWSGSELAPLAVAVGRERTATSATAAATSLMEDPRPRSTTALVEALATTRLDERPAERDAEDASRAGARLLTTSTPATRVIDMPLAEAFAARRADLRELRAATRALSDDTPSDARSGIESRRSSISTSAIVVRDFSGEARGRPPFGQAISIRLGIGDDAPFS